MPQFWGNFRNCSGALHAWEGKQFRNPRYGTRGRFASVSSASCASLRISDADIFTSRRIMSKVFNFLLNRKKAYQVSHSGPTNCCLKGCVANYLSLRTSVRTGLAMTAFFQTPVFLPVLSGILCVWGKKGRSRFAAPGDHFLEIPVSSRKSRRYWEGVMPSAFLNTLVNTR